MSCDLLNSILSYPSQETKYYLSQKNNDTSFTIFNNPDVKNSFGITNLSVQGNAYQTKGRYEEHVIDTDIQFSSWNENSKKITDYLSLKCKREQMSTISINNVSNTGVGKPEYCLVVDDPIGEFSSLKKGDNLYRLFQDSKYIYCLENSSPKL